MKKSSSLRGAVVAAVLVYCLQPALARQGTGESPPLPFEDAGACPFEGCAYREWVATAAVTVRTDRQDATPAAFRVAVGEHVTAVTGVVVTRRAGRVVFREAARLDSDSGRLDVAPGDTLYLLTYEGEGFTKAWFRGRVHTGVDVSDFIGGACDRAPSRCAGRLVERASSEWWVRIRNRQGQEGWTRETEKFDGKDALA